MPVINIKPQNKVIINTKPQNKGLVVNNFTYLENKTIRKGEPMGLLLALTYPASITFVGPRI